MSDDEEYEYEYDDDEMEQEGATIREQFSMWFWWMTMGRDPDSQPNIPSKYTVLTQCHNFFSFLLHFLCHVHV